jgi:hypothetical protein
MLVKTKVWVSYRSSYCKLPFNCCSNGGFRRCCAARDKEFAIVNLSVTEAQRCV